MEVVGVLGIAGPDEADFCGGGVSVESALPVSGLDRIGEEVGDVLGDGIEGSIKGGWEAHGGQVKVEGGAWIVGRVELRRAGDGLEKLPQGRAGLQDYVGAALGEQGDVTGGEDGVAEALLLMNEDGLSCDILSGDVGEARHGDGVEDGCGLADLQAVFESGPTGLKIALDQVKEGKIGVGLRKVGVGGQSTAGVLEGQVVLAQEVVGDAEDVVGVGVVGAELEGAEFGGDGFIGAAELGEISAKRVPGFGILGCEHHEFFIEGLGRVEAVELVEDAGEIVDEVGGVGGQVEGTLEDGDGILALVGFHDGQAEHVEEEGIIGLKCHGAVKSGSGLGGIGFAHIGFAEADPDGGEGGGQGGGAVVGGDGGVKLGGRIGLQGLAASDGVLGQRIVGVGREELEIQALGLGELVGLKEGVGLGK